MAMALQQSTSSADLPEVKENTSLGIEEPLQDIIVKEYSTAQFECKLAQVNTTLVTWFKDGKEVFSSQRIDITNEDQWYRLKITGVSVEDIGLYVILCTDITKQVMSKANLYVRPIKHLYNNDGILYMDPSISGFSRIKRHLNNSSIKYRERIELEFELATPSIEVVEWYKSNCLIYPDTRVITLNDKKLATLAILKAEVTDTGLYHIVVKTEHGIVSSFADILVNDNQVDKEAVPTIEEPLSDEMEVNEKEDMRFICKANFDTHTVIQWFKNGVPLQMDQRILTEDYGNKCVALRIMDTKQTDTGEYSIMLRNVMTGHFDSSSCFATFIAPPNVELPEINVVKPLDTIVATFGSKVVLKCSFDLKDPKYFYVVWYVGRFRVERTNHRFNVLINHNEFYLVIKQLEHDMAGRVVCELRRALPGRKSALAITTSSYVIIVPPSFFNQELRVQTQSKRRIYYRMGSESEIDESETLNMDVFSDDKSDQQVTDEIMATEDGKIMEIDYCRLEDDGLCFMDVLNTHNEMCYSSLTASYKDDDPITDNTSTTFRTIVIKWNAPRLNAWYAVDYWLYHGFYLYAGVASLPMFELEQPGIENVMKLRIRAVAPDPNATDISAVSIVSPPENPPSPSNIPELKTMEAFDILYTKTDDVIGCGAFGSVVLVNSSTGDQYAAKLLKTRTQKKRDYALREYYMMKRLKHPKLVRLVDAFMARDSFVLVMDYLWGGELFDRIVEEEHIKEVDVVPYVRQTCEALQYLHAQNIAHLDVKPENIICLNPNSRQVKLIDFGLARVLDEMHITRAIYGTKDYVAPEVLNYERLTLSCDMWSLGVVTYMLLSGVMPFSGETWPQRSANIIRANYNYHESAFKEISDLAKDFVDRLLVLCPQRRMSASVALDHKWIVEGPPKGAKAGHMRQTRENLKSFLANYRARWQIRGDFHCTTYPQRAGNVLIAAHRLRNQVGQRSSSENAALQIT